jgi:hypothetical protein
MKRLRLSDPKEPARESKSRFTGSAFLYHDPVVRLVHSRWRPLGRSFRGPSRQFVRRLTGLEGARASRVVDVS